MKTSIISIVCAAVLTAASVSAATNCCQKPAAVVTTPNYRVEYNTVTEPVQQTAYKKVVETNYIEEKVTTYETVWETEKRERRTTIARQVPETSMTERRYTVQKPVDEIEYRDDSYEITRLVPETTEREEKYLVSKQVMETQERQIIETRKVPVTETEIQQRVYTVNKPVTNYVQQTIDRGQYVTNVVPEQGRDYTRLAWHRANYIDPATGESKWRIPGFYWTDMQGPTRYTANKVYQPSYVTETVPVTTTIREQRIDEVPVTRTTYRDEQIVRTEPVQVPRTIQEEVVRKVPITTYKQVVERVEKKTPVTVRRYVPEEVVEQVPQTAYKTVYEEKIEPYEVKVAKVVPVTRTVSKPVTTEKWVPYTYTIERQKTVVNKIPLETSRIVSVRDVPAADTSKKEAVNPASIAKPENPASVQAASKDTLKSTLKEGGLSKDAADKIPVIATE